MSAMAQHLQIAALLLVIAHDYGVLLLGRWRALGESEGRFALTLFQVSDRVPGC